MVVGAAALTLAGCGPELVLAFAGVNAASYATSGKLLSDHAMSAATRQDCSIRHDRQGMAYCVETGKPPVADPGVRCYRSIAEVTCYRGAPPLETVSRQVQ